MNTRTSSMAIRLDLNPSRHISAPPIQSLRSYPSRPHLGRTGNRVKLAVVFLAVAVVLVKVVVL